VTHKADSTTDSKEVSDENQVNGTTSPVSSDKLSSTVDTTTPVLNHEPVKGDIHVAALPTKTKAQLTSLVDYPDDDEESDNSTDEEEVPSSPAKKQRIGST